GGGRHACERRLGTWRSAAPFDPHFGLRRRALCAPASRECRCRPRCRYVGSRPTPVAVAAFGDGGCHWHARCDGKSFDAGCLSFPAARVHRTRLTESSAGVRCTASRSWHEPRPAPAPITWKLVVSGTVGAPATHVGASTIVARSTSMVNSIVPLAAWTAVTGVSTLVCALEPKPRRLGRHRISVAAGILLSQDPE